MHLARTRARTNARRLALQQWYRNLRVKIRNAACHPSDIEVSTPQGMATRCKNCCTLKTLGRGFKYNPCSKRTNDVTVLEFRKATLGATMAIKRGIQDRRGSRKWRAKLWKRLPGESVHDNVLRRNESSRKSRLKLHKYLKPYSQAPGYQHRPRKMHKGLLSAPMTTRVRKRVRKQ